MGTNTKWVSGSLILKQKDLEEKYGSGGESFFRTARNGKFAESQRGKNNSPHPVKSAYLEQYLKDNGVALSALGMYGAYGLQAQQEQHVPYSFRQFQRVLRQVKRNAGEV